MPGRISTNPFDDSSSEESFNKDYNVSDGESSELSSLLFYDARETESEGEL
jgi:hypothetical protein